MREAAAGVPFRRDASDYYADDVHSFFMHCYHIRDWLTVLGHAPREDVDAFINDHFELRTCADLCNGTKHLRRTQRPRSSHQPYVAGHGLFGSGQTTDPASGSATPTTLQCQFEVYAESDYYDALWLASRCMELWDEFISGLRTAS
jgi:hypothetical protein